MSPRKILLLAAVALVVFLSTSIEVIPADDIPAADLVVKNGKIVTVDKNFTIVQALAVNDDKIVAIGTDAAIAPRIGPKTKVIDAGGKTIVPGLYDSHTHPVGAATSEIDDEIPYLTGLDDVFAYIRKKTETTPEGKWIVLRYAFPTRLKEARFPTIAELDAVAPSIRSSTTPGRRASRIRWGSRCRASPGTRRIPARASSFAIRRPASRRACCGTPRGC